jgi:hypothetical protein
MTAADEDVERKEPSCIGAGILNLFNHYGRQYGGSSKN